MEQDETSPASSSSDVPADFATGLQSVVTADGPALVVVSNALSVARSTLCAVVPTLAAATENPRRAQRAITFALAAVAQDCVAAILANRLVLAVMAQKGLWRACWMTLCGL